MAADRVYNEEEIEEFGNDYDQPKPFEDDERPYRTLEQWYLTSEKHPASRAALPELKFKRNQVLCGRLQGNTKEIPPIDVKIPVEGYQISVDFTEETRGLWVATKKAWYWLHRCHESQDEIHQITRAKFGLMSNLIDIFKEGSYFDTSHCNLSPKEVHQKLSCLDDSVFETFKQNRDDDESLIFQEPFDYTLLTDQGGITLLKHHLGHMFPGLMIKTKFWEELKKITERKRGTAKWTPDQFRASAELAEERSQRTPWGQRLPNAKKIQPNWNMKENLDQERYVESPKAKRRQRQADGADEAAKKKRKKQRLVPGEDKSERMMRQEMAMTAKKMKQKSYSEERMVQALDDLKDLLTPMPTRESGKWDDITGRTFMVKDIDSAIAVRKKMRESNVTRSTEWKLLIVTAFLNVCTKDNKAKEEKKIIASLCKGKKGGTDSGLGIFERWRIDALGALNGLAKLKTDNKEWFKDIVDRHLLVGCIKFIKKCFVIDSAENLAEMKQKYDINWNHPDFLNDVKEFESIHAYSSFDLRRECELTQTHLQQIINPEEKASAPESATVPVPAPTPAAHAGIREPIPNQATVGSASSLDRDTDMQSRLSAEDKESERKQNLAREERKKRILEKASRVQVFATFQQSSSLSANSASQEVSRNPTKLAPAKAAPVSTPRAPGPVLDLSKKPRKKIVPQYVDVAGNEFFFYQTVPPQDVTRDRNSRDPESTLPPPRDIPVLNLSKISRQKIVPEFVKVTGNEFFFYQPVSQQDMTRSRNSRDSKQTVPPPRDVARRDTQRDERYEDRTKENGRFNGNYGQLGESSQGKRYPRDRSPDHGCLDFSGDRRHDVQAMYVDHRRSLDRYDTRPRSPGRLDPRSRSTDRYERQSRSPNRYERCSRSPRQHDRLSRSPGRFDRRSRSPDRHDRRSRSPGRASRNYRNDSGSEPSSHSYVLSADHETISSDHGRIGEHQERQPAFRPTEGSRNGHNGANEMGDAQSQQASMPPSSASAAVLHSMPVSVPSSQPALLTQVLGRMTPAQPPTAVHLHPAPVASMSSGRGRGRTMPAWMERIQANASSGPPPPTAAAQPAPNDGRGGMGRGLRTTKPARQTHGSP